MLLSQPPRQPRSWLTFDDSQMNAAKRELLVFALADHAFREADALAEHLIVTAPPSDSHLFAASVTGIVTSYFRPFMDAKDLPKLPDEFSQFPEPHLAMIHKTVKETRHKLAAHFDRKHSEKRHQKGELPLPPSEVIIDLRLDGFVVSSNASYLNPALLHQVRELCAFQIKRTNDRLGSFAVEILQKEKRLGEFKFMVE